MTTNSTSLDPRLIEMNGVGILETKTSIKSDERDFTLDRDWAKRAFMVSDSILETPRDIVNRYWSSASAKFIDTRLGGNIGINSRPQFTRYADIRVKGRLQGRQDVTLDNTNGQYGLGRYYSEAIDDPSQTIYLRFGVPQFNSLTNFISKAFDPNMTSIARTGRAPSVFYDLGRLAGTAAAVIAFPAIAITIVVGRVIASFFVRSTSKFYTLKPTMHNYWSTVNLLANTIAINKGIFPKLLDDAGLPIGKPFKLDEGHLKALSGMMPDVFRGNDYFDMYSIANAAQRMANRLENDDFDKLNRGTATDFTGYLTRDLTGDGAHATPISDDNGKAKLSVRINQVLRFSHNKTEKNGTHSETNPSIDAGGKEIKDEGFFSELAEDLDAEFRDGSQFAAFKVNSTGSIGESFGNSAVESDIAQQVNGASSSFRQTRFSLAEGNVAGGVGEVIQAASDVATGALSGATFGFSDLLKGLAGNGYLDVPKYWQSSTANLPKNNYSIKLISPYNNIISQMQNIYIPLAMLLAGTLPLSTGKQSYTSPFICELFDRGRCQIRLGLIESLSITRGTSNLPFDTQGKALAIDVSFSVVDLSSIMHMPVSTGSLFGTDMTLDEDNVLSDYLAVLAGQDIYSQIYAMPKAKLALAKKVMQAKKLTSPAYWGSLVHESTTSGALQYLTFGAFNALEGVTRGSSIVGR